jgi:hypothetical protein
MMYYLSSHCPVHPFQQPLVSHVAVLQGHSRGFQGRLASLLVPPPLPVQVVAVSISKCVEIVRIESRFEDLKFVKILMPSMNVHC